MRHPYKSSWGRTDNSKEDCPGLILRAHGTASSTATPTPLGDFLPQFLSLHRLCICINVTAGWATFPASTSPSYHLHSWVELEQYSYVSCSRLQQYHQSPYRELNLGPFIYQADALTTYYANFVLAGGIRNYKYSGKHMPTVLPKTYNKSMSVQEAPGLQVDQYLIHTSHRYHLQQLQSVQPVELQVFLWLLITQQPYQLFY